MQKAFTIITAKVLLRVSRALGSGGGSALPGLVAERLDPAIGRKLASSIKGGSIVVTGTNGKTTTSKMLAQILDDAGENVVANRAGSNLSRGVVSALIENSTLRGKVPATMGLLEVDEASMPAVCRMVQPRAIVVMNLFRDQLDRYGELDTTAKMIGRGIAQTEAHLFLNADDPLVASLASYAKGPVTYFGINDVPTEKLAHDVTADSNNCPVCDRALKYKENYFGHIGHYSCPKGHFDRPEPKYGAEKLKLSSSDVRFKIKGYNEEMQAPIPGLYNVYNAIAASAVAIERGLEPSMVSQSLSRTEAAFGRVEKLTIGSKTIYLLLVKNPTGFNQVLQTFLLQEKQQNVLIAINDNFADGRDVSWLWDVAFEELSPQRHDIYVSGTRATDMALRLKYADIPTVEIQGDLRKALNQFIAQLPENSIGYVVPTYTAMLSARKTLARATKLKGVWQ